ncbi:hypothetical protein, partial [Escherichia coli]|uniref:hypothetical protein n=1 Tax=Escherichia coli TaxID=562 RepID=UPI000B1A8880
MANPTVIKLQDGNVMPQLGLGVWQASNEEVITAGNDSNLLIVFYVQIMPDDF